MRSMIKNKKYKNMFISIVKNIVIKNVNHTKYNKNALLVYVTKPFVKKNLKIKHPNYYEAINIVRVIGEMEYNVDVVFVDADGVKNYKKYDLIIGQGKCFTNSIGNTKAGCIRIYYATGACWLVAFYSELLRWKRFYKEKGYIETQTRFGLPYRPELEMQSMMDVNAIICHGGKWCKSTYNIFNKPIYEVCATGISKWKYVDMARDINECRYNYIWFGGNGLIHKGLDICIEAFQEINNAELYICCQYEKKFFDKYKEELKCDNIHFIGFVNTESEEFYELMNKCAFILGTSCSEGICTSIITCMQTGLIPITSVENDIDYGIKLDNCEVDTVVNAIREASEKYTDDEMKIMMKGSYAYAENNTGAELYYRKMKYAMEKIINT